MTSPVSVPGLLQPDNQTHRSKDWGICRTRAVIDFAEFEVTFEQLTTFQAVQRRLDAALRLSVLSTTFVEPRNEARWGASRCFMFRVHDVEPETLRVVDHALRSSFKLLGVMTIVRIEISVDFYLRKGAALEEIYELTRRLATRLRAGGLRPRQRGHATGQETKFIRTTSDRLLNGCTVWFGNKRDDVFWRVYPKVEDQKCELPPEQQRARVEFNAQACVLAQWGLCTLEDLIGFDFRAHLADRFKFRQQRDGEDRLGGTSIFSILTRRKGVTEARGMHAFEGVANKRGRRINKFSPLTSADSFLTAKVGKALDRLTGRYAGIFAPSTSVVPTASCPVLETISHR